MGQIARAAGRVYVRLTSESSGAGDSVARWDGDGWTTFAVPDGAQAALFVVDGEIYVLTADGSMQSIERPAERLAAPPPVPDRDPWNASRSYVEGTDGALLWLQKWTVHPERTGRYDEYMAVDRFQNGRWEAVALLEAHPATVLDLGDGSLLVEGSASGWDGSWDLIRPAL